MINAAEAVRSDLDGEDFALAPAVGGFERVDDQSVDRILKAVRQHLGTEIAFVSRYVENFEKELTHIDADIELPMGPGYRDSRNDSYCWHIAEGRLPQLIQDPADFPFTQSLAITDMLPVGCHLNVPLRLSDGSLYGSFCCLSRKPDRSMTERDLGVLKAFAALAAEQIERSVESSAQSRNQKSAIQKVLDTGHVTILHQPIVALKNGHPVGVECLARFPDAAERGPDRWFAEAAGLGLGPDLELLAIQSGLATINHLPADAYLSVNASPETIMSGLLDKVVYKYSSRKLAIEVTEHEKVDDFGKLKECLARLSPFARIAIDDVGAGYSGLRHLVELKPSLLKLDMSLTRDIHTDLARQALATAMVHFAREIGAKLVAEGIEREEERVVLAELGVDYGQGFFFARPMPVVASAQYMLGSRII
ncbi:EAL domain-containing protein [Qipengyuania sp. ASV99]|uniref:sensor domain-containing phosphodiesterase n=1 Tax=Qipengyuania sp. ASV99 TaxID=3399681 RepID=UPI003A4C56F7